MNETEVGFCSVEDFLADERKKLSEDRKTLELILTLLKDEQQIHSNALHDANVHVEFARDKTTRQVNNPNKVETSKKCQSYNSQVEKERLAYLFENAPNSLYLRWPSKTRHKNERCKLNKENQDPSCCCPRPRNLASDSETNRTNSNVQKKVRICPSSPAIGSDRLLFGLGEYEGRRRVFLEKKKQEYVEYLSNMKKNKMLQRLRSKRMDHQDEEYGSENQENVSPNNGSHEDTKWNYRYSRIQQENYRKELDMQIEEKKRLEEERKNRELLECEKSQSSDMQQRQNLMKRIEEDFHRRLKVLNDCKLENEVEKNDGTEESSRDHLSPRCEDDLSQIRDETVPSFAIRGQNSQESNNHFAEQTIETCSINDMNAYEKMKKELYKRELTKQMKEKRSMEKGKNDIHAESGKQHQGNTEIPLYLKNPFMKQNAESWTIDNLEEYQRMKDMVYKEELDKQVEEKRKLERENKAKAEIAEQKLEEKLKKDEARRLKEEHEKEASVIQDNVFPQSFHENKKKNLGISKFPSKSLVKPRSVSTDSRFKEKAPIKNVSFAPRTYVYSFDNDENLDNIPAGEKSSECRNSCTMRTNDSIIIEAPYILASKNISDFTDRINHCGRKRSECQASPEYLPIPSNTASKPPPGIANLPIPSAVSMSEQAIQEYFKTSAFSDLSKIRRMLREQKSSAKL